MVLETYRYCEKVDDSLRGNHFSTSSNLLLVNQVPLGLPIRGLDCEEFGGPVYGAAVAPEGLNLNFFS